MSLIKKIIQFFKPISQYELNEQYLAQSKSIQELEAKMRELEKNT